MTQATYAGHVLELSRGPHNPSRTMGWMPTSAHADERFLNGLGWIVGGAIVILLTVLAPFYGLWRLTTWGRNNKLDPPSTMVSGMF